MRCIFAVDSAEEQEKWMTHIRGCVSTLPALPEDKKKNLGSIIGEKSILKLPFMSKYYFNFHFSEHYKATNQQRFAQNEEERKSHNFVEIRGEQRHQFDYPQPLQVFTETQRY